MTIHVRKGRIALHGTLPLYDRRNLDRILAVIEGSRSTWQMWHVRAEAQRQVRTIDVPAEVTERSSRMPSTVLTAFSISSGSKGM